MSDTNGTCEYVLDPDDPDTWGGEEGDECYVDEVVLNEDGVWTCPHDAEDEEDLCIFHLPVDEKNDEIVIDVFLDLLDEDGDESDTRNLQFLGGQFGAFDLSENPPSSVKAQMESLLMYHTKFSGDIEWSETRIRGVTIFEGAEFGGDTKFDGIKFEGDTSFKGATFVKDSRFRNVKFGGNTYFEGAEFKRDTDFRSAKFAGKANFKQAIFGGFAQFLRVSFDKTANFWSAKFDEGGHFGDATFTGKAPFGTTEFTGVSFKGAEFKNRFSLGNSKITEGVDFKGTIFGDSVAFNYSDLGDANFEFAEFKSNVYFSETVFDEKAIFHGTVFREFAEFDKTNFGETVTFSESSFKKQVIFEDTTLGNAELDDADLTGASFIGTSLSGANLELTRLSRATLFGVDLRGAQLSGAVLGDVRIDEDTQFLGHPFDDSNSSPHTLSAIRSQPTCVYDPDYKEDNEYEDVDKAKSVYRALEELGGKHARPRLQARSFVRRQDLQKQDYWDDATADDASLEERFIAGARWSRAKMARATLLYGESPWRVIAWSLGIIFSFALLYPLGGWIKPADGDPITYAQIASNPVEILNSVYYSTLTYTALGFGDFQPVGLGRLLTTVETGLGAVMLALLVFILGRRAAR